MACPGSGTLAGGETLMIGGALARGFALGADPTTPTPDPNAPQAAMPAAAAAAVTAAQPFFNNLTSDQQNWIKGALAVLNSAVMTTSGTSCPTWVDPGVNIGAATGCFQLWYNANFSTQRSAATATGPAGQLLTPPLRVDGVFDQDSLCALQRIAARDTANFPTAFPDPKQQFCQAACPQGQTRDPKTGQCAASTGLSTGAMVGIGVAGAAALGGIVYAMTRKGGGKRRSRRR